MKITRALFGLAVLICSVLAAQTATDAHADLPYPVVPFHYDGELGGKHVRLTGSADQIISQFNKLYPDSAINVTSPITGGYGAYYKNQVVFKRNKAPPTLCCDRTAQPWFYVSNTAINNAIAALSLLDSCVVQPRSCVRLSCGWGNAAIFLCNDRFDTISPSCNYLASYASDTIRDCSSNGNSCGQLFDTDSYNVITRQDVSCFGAVFGG